MLPDEFRKFLMKARIRSLYMTKSDTLRMSITNVFISHARSLLRVRWKPYTHRFVYPDVAILTGGEQKRTAGRTSPPDTKLGGKI